MHKLKGFTLIELIIAITIIVILSTLVGSFIYGKTSLKDLFSGVTCKAGYKFSMDANGYQQQIFDENNRAIPCDK